MQRQSAKCSTIDTIPMSSQGSLWQRNYRRSMRNIARCGDCYVMMTMRVLMQSVDMHREIHHDLTCTCVPSSLQPFFITYWVHGFGYSLLYVAWTIWR